MNTINPVTSLSKLHKPAFSSLELMTLIFKINSQMEKTASSSFVNKRTYLSIFEKESFGQRGLKIYEGYTVLSLGILAAASSMGSVITKNQLSGALKVSAKILPTFTQATQSLFSAPETLYNSKKQIALNEADSEGQTSQKLDQQLAKNLDSLSTLVKESGKINQLR